MNRTEAVDVLASMWSRGQDIAPRPRSHNPVLVALAAFWISAVWLLTVIDGASWSGLVLALAVLLVTVAWGRRQQTRQAAAHHAALNRLGVSDHLIAAAIHHHGQDDPWSLGVRREVDTAMQPVYAAILADRP